jgi:hypothetical protein
MTGILAVLAGMGGISVIVAVSRSASSTAGFGGGTTATISFNADGTYSTFEGATEFDHGNWVEPAGAANEWEIRATVTSGSTPTSGTVGSFLALSTTREWQVARGTTGTSTSTLTFEWRRVGLTTIEYTTTGNVLTATVEDE